MNSWKVRVSIYQNMKIEDVAILIKECNLKLLSNFAVRSRPSGKEDVSFNDLYNPTLSTPHENPPFVPGFFILKVLINETEIVKNVCYFTC